MISPMLMCMTIEIGRQHRTAEIIDSLLQKFIQSTLRERPKSSPIYRKAIFSLKGNIFLSDSKGI